MSCCNFSFNDEDDDSFRRPLSLWITIRSTRTTFAIDRLGIRDFNFPAGLTRSGDAPLPESFLQCVFCVLEDFVFLLDCRGPNPILDPLDIDRAGDLWLLLPRVFSTPRLFSCWQQQWWKMRPQGQRFTHRGLWRLI